MKVLFVSKEMFMEPLGIMYLSSSAKSHNHQTSLAIMDNEGKNVDEKIAEFHPDVVAFSIITGDHMQYSAEIKRLKQLHPDLYIVAGGPHPTFFPEFLEQTKGLDAICRGEGEEAFTELLDKRESHKDTSDVKNFWLKTKEGIKRNPVRPVTKDLDSIPFPDRNLVYESIPKIARVPIRHFIASRGCPYNCTYCFNHANAELYKKETGEVNRTRFRGIENVLREIAEVSSSHPTQVVYFQDDTFILNNRLAEFSAEYAAQVGIPFHAHVRANLLDDAIIKSLQSAGCSGVNMAAETADDYLRNRILKRNMSMGQIISGVEKLQGNGIDVMLQNMIGLPGGSLEKDLETLKMNIRAKPKVAWVSIYQPYPGTALGELCRRQGLYTGDFSDVYSNFYSGSVLKFPQEYKRQLVILQRLFGTVVDNPWMLETPPHPLLKWLKTNPNEETMEAFLDMQRAYRLKADHLMYQGVDL